MSCTIRYPNCIFILSGNKRESRLQLSTCSWEKLLRFFAFLCNNVCSSRKALSRSMVQTASLPSYCIFRQASLLHIVSLQSLDNKVFRALRDWLKNLAPLSRPIKSNAHVNGNLFVRVFPRLAPVTCICFEF